MRSPWFLIVVLASTGTLAAQQTALRIVEPASDEILYGRTRVVANTSPGLEIGQVLFYLDRFERPICRATESPFTCEFDAGVDFQSRAIRAVALDSRGKRLGHDSIETLAFPKPERVVEYSVTVPVVARTRAASHPDLRSIALGCFHGGKPCEIVKIELLEFGERTPLSIELLVDVSPSVVPNRPELVEAVTRVIDAFPEHAEMAIAEFAGRYRRLGSFTADCEVLRGQVQLLSHSVPSTCLYRALNRSLERLRGRPGHRALFVISDGEDTCDSSLQMLRRNYLVSRTDMGALYHTVELSRSVGAMIYVYRLKDVQTDLVKTTGDRPYEGLARETGGRLFASGNLYGMSNAFTDVIEDLQSTWLVDVTLPRRTEPGTARRLELVPPEGADVRLRYPEYWDAGSREAAWVAQLRAETGATRLHAARRLAGSDNPESLRALFSAVSREPDETIRAAEFEAILSLSERMLVHGGAREQKTALNAMEKLEDVAPELLARMKPALGVYQKLDVPDRRKRRAQHCHELALD